MTEKMCVCGWPHISQLHNDEVDKKHLVIDMMRSKVALWLKIVDAMLNQRRKSRHAG